MNKNSQNTSKTMLNDSWLTDNFAADRYEIRGEFAGGMGKVYRVYDHEWNREMAVKIPHSRLTANAEIKKSFEEECLTWINLGLHPNIVPCHYIKTIGQNFCIFSEFLTGGSLLDLIRTKRLYQESYAGEKIARIIDIAIQMARGLEHAHKYNVIHCDIKPANIMLTADGTAMITDFGLAKACHVKSINNPATQNILETIYSSTGGLTPAYCAPEQIHSDVVTRRTDVWSWAVTILEMLAGSVFWPDGRYAAEALTWLCSRQINNLPVDMALVPEKLLILLAYCFRSKEAGRPKDFEIIGRGLIAIYTEFTGKKYPLPKPNSIDLDAPSLNNKAVSLIELAKSSTTRKSADSAFSVFNKLQEHYHDYATGKFNNLIYQWRNLSLSVKELNRRIDNLYLPLSSQNLIVSKISLELEKLDFSRADSQISLLSDDNNNKQILQKKATEGKEKVHRTLESYFSSMNNSYNSRLEKIIDKLYDSEISNQDIASQVSPSSNGYAAILLENGKELSLIDLKTCRVKWNIKLDHLYDRVAVSENAELIAIVSIKRCPDSRHPFYNLTLVSGKDGSLIGAIKNQEIYGQVTFKYLATDDHGNRISLWWESESKIHECVHDLCNGQLTAYKLDLRKASHYQNFERMIIDSTGSYLLFWGENQICLWQNIALGQHVDHMFNLFRLDLSDYKIKNHSAKGYLPGLEPLVNYSDELTVERLHNLLPVLLSLRTTQKVSYVICQPSDIQNLLIKQDQRDVLLSRVQVEEQKGNIVEALALYAAIIHLGEQQETILFSRHNLVQKLGQSVISEAWHERTYDYYWQGNIFGLTYVNKRLLMQCHGQLESVRLPNLCIDSSFSFNWHPSQNMVMIGVLAVEKGKILVFSHETKDPYHNKLTYCNLVENSLGEIWALDYESGPGWEWPLERISCIGNLLFAESKPGVLIKLAVTEDFQLQEMILDKPVSFLKAIRFDGNHCLFVAFKDKGFLLLDSDGNRIDFDCDYLNSARLLKICAVSDNLSAIAYWPDSSTLTVISREKKLPVDIWSKSWKADDRWFSQKPHSISISPNGAAVAYVFDQQLFVKCTVTGKEVLKWICESNKTVQSVVFDESSRWLFAVTGINTIEQFQMFWVPETTH